MQCFSVPRDRVDALSCCMSTRSWIPPISELKTSGLSGALAGAKGAAKMSRKTLFLVYSLSWAMIFCAAWAIRLWHLDASDLTFDEAATYVVANRPFFDIISYLLGAVREHPPVFYLLMRPWMTIAGTSEYSLRFFAVCASLVGIALTARLARKLTKYTFIRDNLKLFIASVIPAVLLVVSPFEVYYARDARMYTLTIVWATLSSLLFLPLLFTEEPEKRPGWLALAALVLTNGLAVFTHYYLVLLIATQFVSLLLLRRWRAFLAWNAAHGLVGLLGVIWLLRSPGLSSSLSEAWGRFDPIWPTVGQLRRLLADVLFGPIKGVPWNLIYFWALLIGIGLLASWLRAFRSRSNSSGAASRRSSVWLTITALLPLILAYVMPEPPRSRFLIFLLPFAAVIVGQIPLVVRGVGKTVLVAGALAALAISILGVYGLPRTVRWIKSDYGHIVAAVSAHARPGDGVLFYGPWQEIQFRYYRPDEFPPITMVPPFAPPLLAPEEAAPVLEELMHTYRRLWVIPAAVDDVDPAHYAAGWLNTHAHPVWEMPGLSLYLPPSEDIQSAAPSGLVFGERLELTESVMDAQAVPAGEALLFTMTWTALEKLSGDVELDLSLVDERGYRWLQWQRIPGQWANPPSNWEPGEMFVDRQGVIVPQGAPPGRYWVRMAVVDRDSGEPLMPSERGDSLAQVNVDVTTFDVVEPISPPVTEGARDFEGPFMFESQDGTSGTLTLSGYDLSGLKFTQGNPVQLTLDWLAPLEPMQAPELSLQLQSHGGMLGSRVAPIMTQTSTLVPGYPAGQWLPGRIVSQPLVLTIPPDALPGRADIALAVNGPDGKTWSVDGDPWLTLGSLTIEERPFRRHVPDGVEAVQVDFSDLIGDSGDQISLNGYQVDGDARPGGQLDLTFVWRAGNQPQRIYSVFNHLLTPDGQPVAQADGWPQEGVVLTTQWRPGEYIEDHHTLEIPADAPPGPYLLVMGLYDAASGDRLQVSVNGKPQPHDQWQLSLGDE